MKHIHLLFFLCLLFCCNNKSKQSIKSKSEIIDIHLSRTVGMIDMTKNISSKYYSVKENEIYAINELSSPKGDILKTDTIQILKKDNSKIFKDFNDRNKLKSFFSDGLQNDSGGWSFTLYYLDSNAKNFIFTSADEIPEYAKSLYDLLNALEK